jgi:hypothetical protein
MPSAARASHCVFFHCCFLQQCGIAVWRRLQCAVVAGNIGVSRLTLHCQQKAFVQHMHHLLMALARSCCCCYVAQVHTN